MKVADRDWYRALGQRIKGRRHELGITLVQAAKPIGVTWQMLWRYEAGNSRLPLDKAVTLARLLRTDLNSLIAQDAQQTDKNHRRSNKT